MANETSLVLKRSEPIDFIVDDAQAIEKGAICMLSGPRTAYANEGVADVYAGIARREKISNDGRTRLSLFTGPGDIVRLTNSTAVVIAAGSYVVTSGPNLVKVAVEADILLGKGIGKTLEELGANGTGEVMLGCI